MNPAPQAQVQVQAPQTAAGAWAQRNRGWLIPVIVLLVIALCCACLALLGFVALGLRSTAAASAAVPTAPYYDPPPVSAPPSGSTAGSAATGVCAFDPVNPVDGVKVVLNDGVYVIEEFDNGKTPPLHQFRVYDVASQGQFTVWASPQLGMRAWRCSDTASAADVALQVAQNYKLNHPTHKVTGPNGQEIK